MIKGLFNTYLVARVRFSYKINKRAVADKKLQANIIANRVKTIEEGKQGKHIPGHNNYIEGKSYLTISAEEAQAGRPLCGHGLIQYSDSGKWDHKEKVAVDKIIGICIDKNGQKVETNELIIHYSKKGTHIVPTLRSDKK